MSDQSDARDQPQLEAADSDSTVNAAPPSAIEAKLMNIAEELGTWLGTAERKTTDFLAQPAVQDSLVKIRDTASRLIAHVEKGRDRSR
jgi:isopentenyl diphosphate isomerase/L-lactate dehydrogenase-like FMN-dependent dehydrogenase